MKKLCTILLLLISLAFIVSCTNEEKVELMYSASYQDTNDFEEVIGYIDNYENYLLSGYPLNINENFFDKYILYSVSSYISVTGRNLYLYEGYLKEEDVLIINLKQADTIASAAEGIYVVIFKINKVLYESVNEIIVGDEEVTFDRNEYVVGVIDPNNFLIESLKIKYLYGETFVIKTSILTDVDLDLYIDNEFYAKQTVIEQNGSYTHWEYYVLMPGHDITISFQTSGGVGILPIGLFVSTFTTDDYGLENVFVISPGFNNSFTYLEETYGITEETEYFIIDTFEKYADIYKLLSGEDAETSNSFVWLFVKRVAQSSSYIKAYYMDHGSYIIIDYPNKTNPGDDAVFTCYDLVPMNQAVYEEFISGGSNLVFSNN